MKSDPIPHDEVEAADERAADFINVILTTTRPPGDTTRSASIAGALGATAMLIAAAEVLEVDVTDLFEQLADYVNSNRN